MSRGERFGAVRHCNYSKSLQQAGCSTSARAADYRKSISKSPNHRKTLFFIHDLSMSCLKKFDRCFFIILSVFENENLSSSRNSKDLHKILQSNSYSLQNFQSLTFEVGPVYNLSWRVKFRESLKSVLCV